MALVSVTLTVGFISQYAGDHRVCYRLGSTGPYDCSTIVTCTGGGAACSVNITLTVDNETCDTSSYEGYVQAVCENVASLIGRVPFTASITPTPPCQSKLLTCTGGIETFSFTGGTGYSTPPNVTVVGGGGSGAILTPVMGGAGGTSVIGLTITNPGSGYTSLPTIVIDPSPSGTSATAVVTQLTGCTNIDFTDCDGNTVNILKGANGASTNNTPVQPQQVCIEEGTSFSAVPEYIVADEGCCYDCSSFSITAGAGGGKVNYQLCDGTFVIGPPMLPGDLIIGCIITNSIVFIEGSNFETNYGFTITNLGPCTP